MAFAPPAVPNWREVRAALAARRFTHRRLAELAGLSEGTVSRWLTGQLEPGELARYRLAHALGELRILDVVEGGEDAR